LSHPVRQMQLLPNTFFYYFVIVANSLMLADIQFKKREGVIKMDKAAEARYSRLCVISAAKE